MNKLNTDCLQLNSDGYVYSTWSLMLPADVSISDLKDHPELWSKIAASQQHPVRVGDRIAVWDHGRENLADAIVASVHADRIVCVWQGVKAMAKQETADIALDDGVVARWGRSGYAAWKGNVCLDLHEHQTIAACRAAYYASNPRAKM